MDEAVEQILLELPQPVFFVGLVLLLVLASLSGRWLRLRVARVSETALLNSNQEGYVVGAVLGLLSLLLGFTFSIATAQHDRRLQLANDEASALGTSYLMAQTFAEPARTQVSGLLSDYVDHRIELGATRERDAATPLMLRGEALQIRLWYAARAADSNDPGSPFLDHLAGALAIGEERLTARVSRIPPRIYLTLLIYSLITAAVMGYAFAGSRQALTTGTLYLLVTLSLVLIIDLDQPTRGAIRDRQEAMENLQRRIDDLGALRRPNETARTGAR